MSYAGVESELEYAQRVIRDHNRALWERSPAGQAAAKARARKTKELRLESARQSLESQQKAVKETRARIKQLEKELANEQL